MKKSKEIMELLKEVVKESLEEMIEEERREYLVEILRRKEMAATRGI